MLEGLWDELPLPPASSKEGAALDRLKSVSGVVADLGKRWRSLDLRHFRRTVTG